LAQKNLESEENLENFEEREKSEEHFATEGASLLAEIEDVKKKIQELKNKPEKREENKDDENVTKNKPDEREDNEEEEPFEDALDSFGMSRVSGNPNKNDQVINMNNYRIF